MNWFNRFRGWLRASTSTAGSTSSNPAKWFIDWVRGGDDSTSGVQVGPDSAQRSSAVYACDQVLRQDVAKVPLYLYKRSADGKSRERAVDHPLYHLVGAEPNSRQTSYEWRMMMQHHLNIRENAFAIIGRDGRRTPNELTPLHPDWVKVLSTPDGDLFYDVRMYGRGEVKRYSSLDILHIRGLSEDGLNGKSRISTLRDVIGLDIAASMHAAKLFANGARPGGLITHPGKVGKAGRDGILKEWNAQYGGPENAYKAAVLAEGMSYSAVAMTNLDAQFIDSRKMSRSEIAAGFRVPAHKIGILENATFSNIEHQALEYVYDTLFPIFTMWEQKLNMTLLREAEKGTYFFEFHRDVLLRGDFKSRMEAWAIARNWSVASSNDAREDFGWNSVENGDEYVVPLNMWPAGLPRPDKKSGVGDATVPPDQQPAAPNT